MAGQKRRRRWGKAGVRLTNAELNALRLKRQASQYRAAEAHRYAYESWVAGNLAPYSITLALDAHGLDGPEVDLACGVEEPAVDRWEEGELYPTWEQLVALAELTGCSVGFFFQPRRVWHPGDTTMKFHCKGDDVPEIPIMRFSDAALAAHKQNLSR